MKTADVLRIYIHTVDTKPLNSVAELTKKKKKRAQIHLKSDYPYHLADKIRRTVM